MHEEEVEITEDEIREAIIRLADGDPDKVWSAGKDLASLRVSDPAFADLQERLAKLPNPQPTWERSAFIWSTKIAPILANIRRALQDERRDRSRAIRAGGSDQRRGAACPVTRERFLMGRKL